MAVVQFSGFVGGSYTLRSVSVSCQQCLNLYAEVNELGGKNQEVASLVGRPGLELLIPGLVSGEPCRGGYVASNGVGYMVKGQALTYINPDTLATEFHEGTVGYIATRTGRVSMADNGTKGVLVDGTNGYTWTLPGGAGSSLGLQSNLRSTGTATDAGGGDVSWTNPSNITVSDDTYATCVITTGQATNDLDATNFGMALPTNAVITGIKLEVECKFSGGANRPDCEVFLLKGGTPVTVARAEDILTTETSVTFGGITDRWDETWSVAEINASDFGARMSVTNNSGSTKTISVDNIRITVYYTLASTSEPAVISDADFPDGATSVAFLDNYFIVNVPGTNRFQLSALGDPTSWDALDFSSKEGRQDNLVGIKAAFREAWLFGDQSIEIWHNTGLSDFPLERTYFIELGCAAAGTIVVIDNAIMWVGKNSDGQGTVYLARGYRPQRISTHAVELAISGYGDISEATAWVYADKGHTFYVLDFPNADTTWVYDLSTGLWAERNFLNPTTGEQSRQRALYHVYVGSRHFVGDRDNSSLYEMRDDIYVDELYNGTETPTDAPIIKLRRFPHFAVQGRRMFYTWLSIEIEPGVGLDVDSDSHGYDPLLELRYSSDGGHTWSTPVTASMGRLGQYNTRPRFDRLGSDFNRVFELKSTEPVKTVWISAFLNVEAGIP